MRKIVASEWQSVAKPIEINTPLACHLQIIAATPGEITLNGITPDGEDICIVSVDRQLNLRTNMEGFVQFILTMTKPGGAKILLNGKETGEDINDERPPVEPEANNILARMRQTAKQQMGITREAFLENDTGLPGYETDVDYTFEEEEAALEKALKNQRDSPQDKSESGSRGDEGNAGGKPKPKPKPDSSDENLAIETEGSTEGTT